MFFLLRAEYWPYVIQQSLSVEALPGVAQCLSTLFIRTLCKDKDLLLKGYVTVSVSIEYLKVSVLTLYVPVYGYKLVWGRLQHSLPLRELRH